MTQPSTAAQAVSPGDSLTTGAESVVVNSDRLGIVWKLRPATVSGGSDPTAISLTMDGDQALISAYSLIGPVAPGARVMCVLVPPSGVYIVGTIGGQTLSNVEVMRYIPDGVSPNDINTTSYDDVDGATLTFTKLSSSTALHIDLKASGQATTTGGVYLCTLGVLIGGIDYDVARHFYNSTALHESFGGDRKIPGISAGTYAIQVRGKVGTSGKTVRIDQNDLVTMTVTELM